MLWTVPECPYQVTIPGEVLNDIRALVVDAFHVVPRGGVEVGGVFFGVCSGDSLHIQTYRPITIQYLTGPSFTLSDEDKLALSDVLRLRDSDPELAGLAVAGWYHSHHRSEIFLSPGDLELYQEFFPERWQIAMVLRPANLQPTRAGFFFRDSGGGIKSDAAVQEFIMDPPPAYGLTVLDPEAENAIVQTLAAHAAPAKAPQNNAAVVNGTGAAVAKESSATPPPIEPASSDIAEAEPEVPPLTLRIPRRLREPETQTPTKRQRLETTRPRTPGDRLTQRPKLSPDRRSVKREPGDGLHAFYFDGGRPRAYQVRDISSHGAFIETDFSWTRGTHIILTLQIESTGEPDDGPPDTIVVPAEVVRTSSEGMGVRFRHHRLNEMRMFFQFLYRWNPTSAAILL